MYIDADKSISGFRNDYFAEKKNPEIDIYPYILDNFPFFVGNSKRKREKCSRGHVHVIIACRMLLHLLLCSFSSFTFFLSFIRVQAGKGGFFVRGNCLSSVLLPRAHLSWHTAQQSTAELQPGLLPGYRYLQTTDTACAAYYHCYPHFRSHRRDLSSYKRNPIATRPPVLRALNFPLLATTGEEKRRFMSKLNFKFNSKRTPKTKWSLV